MHIQALQYDHDLAEKTLDTTFELWKDMTVLDVVMFAKCESFSEQCCLRILRTMQFGDIKIDGEQGVMWKIFFSLVTGGLAVFIFPNLVEFEPPPVSEMLRLSTQHRDREKGYPYKPHENSILARIAEQVRQGLLSCCSVHSSLLVDKP